MKKLTLTNHAQSEITVLENEFIDHYMVAANGEYVKVYLLLLRHLNEPDGSLTVSHIADLLEITEKDVIRALNYWKKQGLLDYETKETLEEDSTEETADVKAPAEQAPNADVSDIQQYKDFKELLFVAEQYLGKTLSSTEVETLTYFYETLQMSVELIEYLIEYCVEMGHKSMHYIQKVALSWHEQGIATVEEAKVQALAYNKTYYSILNAFGIKGRNPTETERKYIHKWSAELGFDLEIILEACHRTMDALHQPSFEYADSILKNWSEKQVHTMADIQAVDEAYQQEKTKKKKPDKRTSGKNNFDNFDNRSYDIDDLERKLVQQ